MLIAVVLVLGCLLSLMGMLIPSLNRALMPRFGWIGLFAGGNILIFIGFWIKSPRQYSLFPASFMSTTIGAINAMALLRSGTVNAVENAFHDRLHSAWAWSVASYFVIAVYFFVLALRDRALFSGTKRVDKT